MARHRIKKGPILTVVGVFLVFIGLWYAHSQGYLSASDSGPSAVPEVASMPEDVSPTANSPSNVAMLPLPSNAAVAVPGPEVRYQIMAWNSQMGLNLANGGPKPTQGSLMAKKGVNLHIIREDDVGKMQTQLIAFCKGLKDNPQPTEGAHFMAVMGDGSAAIIVGMNSELLKLGCTPEVIGSAGYSRGEDKFMGPPDWKTNPKKARGGLIATYLRDGDWAIVMKWAGDNNIPVNPDEHTYDPGAINWYAVDDFVKAGTAYIQGICEGRPVVREGKRTGEKKNVCVNAVSSWTPVDVNVAHEKGGLINIVSTKEYSKQMPNTIIGLREWDEANRQTVENMLAAIYEAGDQIKAYPQALQRAAEASAAIYKEEDAAYWVKYYNLQVETDKTGLQVELGGSSVNNLQDVMHLYGLLPGSPNYYAATYTIFGNIVKQQYPKLVPDFLPVDKVLNTSYTTNISKRANAMQGGKAEVVKYTPKQEIKDVVSKRSWSINFATGSANFAGDAIEQLDELRDGLLVADELILEVHGYTDNTGDPTRNIQLSQARANAVKNWLMQQSSTSFPADRFAKVVGHGQSSPIATNDTESGRAKNRRVEVVLGL